jgi:hypothetical protein
MNHADMIEKMNEWGRKKIGIKLRINWFVVNLNVDMAGESKEAKEAAARSFCPIQLVFGAFVCPVSFAFAYFFCIDIVGPRPDLPFYRAIFIHDTHAKEAGTYDF